MSYADTRKMPERRVNVLSETNSSTEPSREWKLKIVPLSFNHLPGIGEDLADT